MLQSRGAEWVKCADRVARVTLKALATPQGARGTTSGFCWSGKTHPAPRRGLFLQDWVKREGVTKHGTEALTKPRGPWGRGRGPQRTTAAGHAWASATHPSCFLLWVRGDPRAPGSSRSVPARVWGQPPASLGVGSGGGNLEREETERERRNSRDGEFRLPLWLRSSEAESPLPAAPARSERSPRPTGSAPEHDTRGLPGGLQEHLPRSPATSRLSPEAAWTPPPGGPRPPLPQLRRPARPKRAHPAH